MRAVPVCHMALMCLLVPLLLSFSYSQGKTVEVVGIGECADCADTKIDTTHAVSGLGVTIDCKTQNGLFKTRGAGELDGEGKFKVSLPDEMVEEDGKLKEECFAQLHSAAALPCPAYDGLDSSKLAFKAKTDDGKHTFSPAGKLKFSPAVCTSEFLWPHYKYPPLPPKKKYTHPLLPYHKKPLYHKHPIPSIPIYKKPHPPVPIYTYKPKPKVPIIKDHPIPHIPIYKKPFPPIFHKYSHPIPKIPYIHKKPCPPIFHKIPKIPHIP